MKLVYKDTGVPVKVGDIVTDFRGDKDVVTGWASPRNSNSTGRIYVTGGEFYPSVFGCVWIEDDC